MEEFCLGGRISLINEVISNIPMYYFSFFKVQPELFVISFVFKEIFFGMVRLRRVALLGVVGN